MSHFQVQTAHLDSRSTFTWKRGEVVQKPPRLTHEMYRLSKPALYSIRNMFMKPSPSKSRMYSSGDPGTEKVTAGESGPVEIMSRATCGRRERNQNPVLLRRRHRTRLPEGARRNNVQFSKRACGCRAWKTASVLEVTENMIDKSHHSHRFSEDSEPGETAQPQCNSAQEPTHRNPRARIPTHPTSLPTNYAHTRAVPAKHRRPIPRQRRLEDFLLFFLFLSTRHPTRKRWREAGQLSASERAGRLLQLRRRHLLRDLLLLHLLVLLRSGRLLLLLHPPRLLLLLLERNLEEEGDRRVVDGIVRHCSERRRRQ